MEYGFGYTPLQYRSNTNTPNKLGFVDNAQEPLEKKPRATYIQRKLCIVDRVMENKTMSTVEEIPSHTGHFREITIGENYEVQK